MTSEQQSDFIGCLGTVIMWSIIVGTAAILRLLYIGGPVTYNEALVYNHYISANLPTIFSDLTHPQNHIFHTFFIYSAVSLFGSAPWVLRLPSLIAGIALIFAQYETTQNRYGHEAGLLAAMLVGLSVPLIEFATHSSGYSMAALLTVLMIWQAQRIVNTPSRGWLLYAILCAISIYTVRTMFYAVGGVSIWFIVTLLRQSERNQVIVRTFYFFATLSLAALFTVFLYWPVIVNEGAASLFFNPALTDLGIQAYTIQVPTTIETMLKLPNHGFSIPLVVMLVVGMAYGIARQTLTKEKSPPVILYVFGFSLVAFLLQPVVLPAATWIILIPPYLMVAAYGIAKLLTASRWTRPIVIALLLFSAVDLATTDTIINSRYTKVVDGVRNAAEVIGPTLSEQDRILAPIPINEPLRYYITLQQQTLAEAVIDLDSLHPNDLLTEGNLYVLAEETTPPAISQALGLGLTSFTIQLNPIATFDDFTLQLARPQPLHANSVVFRDRFDEPTLPGWNIESMRLTAVGTGINLRAAELPGHLTLIGGTEWQNYAVHARFRSTIQNNTEATLELHVRNSRTGGYIVRIDEPSDTISIGRGDATGFYLGDLQQTTVALEPNRFYDLRVRVNSNEIEVSLNSEPLFAVADDSYTQGNIRIVVPANNEVLMSHLEVSLIAP